jgi:subtilisin family serine protease
MVGAASSATPHRRLAFSNFGSRVDCFAWGEHIDTSGDGFTGQDPHVYTTDFGGTSGASPIVAGCAVLLQALRRANGLVPHSPAEVRALLSDSAINTVSADPAGDLIGVMPDLRAIAQRPAGGSPPSRVRSVVVTE